MVIENKIKRFPVVHIAADVVKTLRLILLVLILSKAGYAQQLKIGDNYTKLDSSAALEIESQRLVLLLPRINDTAKVVTTVKDGALLFYQPSTGLNKGPYVRAGARWELLPPFGAGANWYTTGNAGTVGNQNFVGTTDGRPLLFKTGNTTRMFIDSTSSGFLGIGTTTPSGNLDNRGATILGAKMMNGFPSSGSYSLGSSINTVDSFTLFCIPQTVNGVSITLPTPTRSSADGRIITIANTGTVPFNVRSFSLGVDKAISFIWASSNWRMFGDGIQNQTFTVPNKYVAPSTVGFMAGAADNTVAQDNIAIGQNALNKNIYGTRNIAIGFSSISANTASFSNVGIGTESLRSSTSGNRNVAIGYRTLTNTSTSGNCAIGAWALDQNTTGAGNTAVGTSALSTNTTGSGNTALGTATMDWAEITANFNTALGYIAGRYVKSSYNTIAGVEACTQLNAGAGYNTAFGYNSGNYDAGTYSDKSVKNATAIGPRAQFLQSNTIIFGSEASTYLTNVGVGIYNPSFKLHINGAIASQGAILTPSDLRLKKNIQPLENALQKILALRGVTYRWNPDVTKRLQLRTDSLVHYGYIAQEVELVLPYAVITATDSFQTKTIEYTALVPVITAAIKQQQTQLQNLTRDQADAEDQLKKMQAQVNRILQTVHEK
ncbi:tail fiber domain-containing protein [Filimonas effusa]|uniref:Tail fiber domain-containing protein n=1 Tax=Filimonas effusa TaxID=2508721 RepID=A0A4Q1CZS4_9BACT|nr:tail fiber domain-containing protein [Filimonas effusa]RXK80826.1 tail fiber domain-containing protein [Filimonas effusa]